MRHIFILPDKLFAIYVIEQEPAWERLRFSKKEKVHEHKVFMPWRYTFVRVRYDTRVDGGNMGYLFFSRVRAETMDSEVLRQALFPNVFEGGGICIGYTTTSIDRSPVRSAWRAVRFLYDIPGNQWMTYAGFGAIKNRMLSKPQDHADHDIDIGCQWSEMTEEQVMAIDLPYVDYKGRSIDSVCQNSRWSYQRGIEWTETDAEKKIKELGGTW